MASKSCGLLAGFALAANAFMIPSIMSVPRAENNDFNALDLARIPGSPGAPKIVKLDCPGCPFDAPEGAEKDADNSLVLRWSVSPNGKAVVLNDRPIIHAGSVAGDGMSSDFVPQVASSVSIDELRDNYGTVTTKPRSLEWAWIGHVEPAADGTDAELMDIDFRVKSFDGRDINTDDLSVRVLKDENDKLSLSDVIKVPKKATGVPAHKQEDEEQDEGESHFTILPLRPVGGPSLDTPKACTSSSARMCRIKAMLDAKMAALMAGLRAARERAMGHKMGKKPCHGKLMHLSHASPPSSMPAPPHAGFKAGVTRFFTIKIARPVQPEAPTAPDAPTSPDSPAQPEAPTSPDQKAEEDHQEPHPPMPHHLKGPRRNCRMARVARVLHRFFFGFVVPVLIGVAAGMTASLLGMVVGTLLAMLWFMVVRRGRKGNASARFEPPAESATDNEAALEKKGLMSEGAERASEDSEAPPVYQEKQ